MYLKVESINIKKDVFMLYSVVTSLKQLTFTIFMKPLTVK